MNLNDEMMHWEWNFLMTKTQKNEEKSLKINLNFKKMKQKDFEGYKKTKKNYSMKKRNELSKLWKRLLKEWVKKNSSFYLILNFM